MAGIRKPASKRFRKDRKPRFALWCGLAVAVLIGLFLLLLDASRPSVDGEALRFDTFLEALADGRVRDARLLDVDDYIVGTYERDDRTVARYHTPYEQFISDEVIDLILDNDVPLTIDKQPGKRLIEPASVLLPTLILAVVFVYMTLSYRSGTGLFSVRSGARKVGAGERGKVTFADVAGQQAAVAELREIKAFLSEPERFDRLGAIVPKGILLFGPPGCGKTLLARAVAGEAGAAFYSISGSDFVELYTGVGAARVRDLFREAREHAPAIVFIDELDSVGRRRRSGGTGSSEEQEQALNQILAEMDGFSPTQGIIVMAATNRPDVLDPALLRPGRFDRTVALERPGEADRLEILSLHAANKALAADADLTVVARRSVGLSGADLASVMNEAALLAARADRASIGAAELEAALDRILEAPERQRRLAMRDRGFGRSTGAEARVTFADVAGVDEAIEELAEVRDHLADPERFAALGARPPRGFLLVGPPGCGKTMLARAVAAEANAAFFSVAATEFVEVFSGEGAGRVRDLFAEARTVAPAIVFLDEIDAVGARRAVALDGNREQQQTLNQILVELDGFDARTGVTVLAATNRPEILDEALVRPGRFDRTITIPLPDRSARRAILAVHAAGKSLAADVDLDAVAAMTQGYSGADLANVMNEGALLAGRQHLRAVPMVLVEEAVERVGVGVARANRLTGEDREIVAYHEVGHALVGAAVTGVLPHKVSIVARGRALGAAWNLDAGQRLVHRRSAMVDAMAVLLGGRAAEELVFAEPASGAADDLQRVAEMARRMVCELGMSEALGPVAFEGVGVDTRPSEHVARTIDNEIHRFVDEAYERARSVLAARRPALDAAAAALVERESLSAGELGDIMAAPGAAGRTRKEPKAASAPRPA